MTRLLRLIFKNHFYLRINKLPLPDTRISLCWRLAVAQKTLIR